MNIKLLDRPLIITDVETTGLYAGYHEIIEVGALVVDPKDFQIKSSTDFKVKPEHPQRITRMARSVNGYNARDWKNAMSLKEAMREYATLSKDGLFWGYNVAFDWSFISDGFRKTGVKNPMDYHRLDIPSIAYEKLSPKGLEKLSADAVSVFLGLPPEAKPHRAINGAMQAYNIFTKLVLLNRP